MNRLEQAIPAGIICAIGIWVAWISFTQQPAEAFAFPRLISAVFVVLAAVVFVNAVIGPGGDGAARIGAATWARLLPGLAIAAVYVFWLAKGLGFYTATCIAVLALVSVYDPAPHTQVSSWVRRLVITLAFVAVMYLLFAMLLGVFTPREVLFR